MLVAAMDPVLATNTTGHDLTPASAMFEYVDHTRAGCMPGSVVLGGWRPIPYGQLGMGVCTKRVASFTPCRVVPRHHAEGGNRETRHKPPWQICECGRLLARCHNVAPVPKKKSNSIGSSRNPDA